MRPKRKTCHGGGSRKSSPAAFVNVFHSCPVGRSDLTRGGDWIDRLTQNNAMLVPFDSQKPRCYNELTVQ